MDLEKPATPFESLETEKVINSIREQIQTIRGKEQSASPEDIVTIQQELEKVSNLVINFDDTITKPPERDLANPGRKRDNYSIRAVCREIIKLGSEQPEFKKNKEEAEYFLQVLDDALPDLVLLAQERKRALELFYEEVLGGLDESTLQSIYKRIISEENPTEAVRLNENFISAIRILAENSEDKVFNLFVLSLNTPDLMKLWYEKFLPQAHAELTRDGITVKVVELMGNQIKWQQTETGEKKVAGVIKHVTNDNKWQYIPLGTIMLADDRETPIRARDFVNVVNIENNQYSPEILRLVKRFSEITGKLKRHGTNLYSPLMDYDELTIALKNVILCRALEPLTPDERKLPYTTAVLTDEELAKQSTFNLDLFENRISKLEAVLEERE